MAQERKEGSRYYTGSGAGSLGAKGWEKNYVDGVRKEEEGIGPIRAEIGSEIVGVACVCLPPTQSGGGALWQQSVSVVRASPVK